MKQLITFQFPTMEAMWAFKHEIHPNFYEMDARKRILSCECSDAETNIATRKYNGRIITFLKESA